MLVLTRKLHQKIVIHDLKSGQRITLEVYDIDRGKVRLGFEADPDTIKIYREEIEPRAA